MRHSTPDATALLVLISLPGFAQEPSRYMGGTVDLVKAPNGAIVNAEIIIRAIADAPVEVVALDRETFAALLAESDDTRDAFEQIVRSCLAENVSVRGGDQA